MTTPTPTTPDAPAAPTTPVDPPAPKKKSRKWLWIGGGIVVFLLGVGVANGDNNAPAPSSPATSGGLSQSAASAPPADMVPAVTDFRIDVRTLRKQCFGSAGCNVTYQIDPTYTGPALPGWKTYRVVYEVTGGEDGPATNNFTVTGGQARFPQQELVSTSSSNTQLTAHAVSVSDR